MPGMFQKSPAFVPRYYKFESRPSCAESSELGSRVKGRAKEVMDRQSDRLPRQTRCAGMRIEREIQMGAAGGGQSIKASGHWPREQAGHKPATDMTVPSQERP